LDEPWNVQFHHTNESQKEIEISQLLASTTAKIEAELKKCKLLCCICHKFVHFRVELYTKCYKDICEKSEKEHPPGRWTMVDANEVICLLREGKTVKEIAKLLRRDQRVVRRVIERLENKSGTIYRRSRTEMANKKITDEQLLEALAAKIKKKEIIKMYGVGNHTLNIRIGKLVQEGKYHPTQPAQIAKILKTMEKAQRRYK
jgi:hypothetical protein